MKPAWHAEAQRMAARGLSNAEIGRRLGYTKGAVWKAVNPEKTAKINRESNAKRLEYKREWDRRMYRGRCEVCGCLTERPQYVRCAEHGKNRERAEARRVEIQQRWLAGESLIEIAEAIGTTVNSVGTGITHMRIAGWDLPYRRKPKAVA